VITITDAIVAGEGDGPLANSPVSSGLLTGGLNVAAIEWVHARLMGFDPTRIPLVREAFAGFSYPLASFPPSRIRVRFANGETGPDEVFPPEGRSFLPPVGWLGHCELKHSYDSEDLESSVVA
jgi:uncharacterized protein (DUF362 family)